jgi:hypothetical protein
MNLFSAIQNPLVNVFDIIEDKNSEYGFYVHTYKKPGETEDEWYERDNKNHEFAIKVKKYGKNR